MRRFLSFLRSVLPADLTQLAFLYGIVCLIIGAHLRWWPISAMLQLSRQSAPQSDVSSLIFIGLAVYPILFASAAGYFVCFWPGPSPALRIWWWVCVPALAAILLLYGHFLDILQAPRASVLDHSAWLPQDLHSALALFGSLGPGFRISLLGLLFIAVYMSRLVFGISHLPLALSGETTDVFTQEKSWRQILTLVWFLIACAWLIMGLVDATVFSFFIGPRTHWFNETIGVLGACAWTFIAIFLMRPQGWRATRNTLRWCGAGYLLLGAFIPIGISCSISVAQYAIDRIYWAAHYFGTSGSPQFSAYFRVSDPVLLLLVFPALCEEVVFRGLLQPRFVQRYGLYRGLFMVGIVWSAFHFFWDFRSRFSVSDAFMQVVFRLFLCVVLGYVLGWLTVRSGSVLPSTLAHWFFNILVFSTFGPDFLGKATVRIALWGLLAYLLFRYWPVPNADVQVSAADDSTLDHP